MANMNYNFVKFLRGNVSEFNALEKKDSDTLYFVYEEDSDRTLIDVLSELKITDPEELIIGQEQIKHIEGEMAKVLSDLEMEVLQSYLDGKSYQEIACDLDRQAKSIDNALQRVKRKLEKCLYYEK